MNLDPLGFLAARHVLDCGRAAFFGAETADLPTSRAPDVAADDLVPQFGYVGGAFPLTRLLVLGINPGNGPNGARSPGDARLMPALRRFAIEQTPDAFVEAQAAYRTACQGWPVWKRHCAEVIGAGRLSLDDIAYSNCLPWRTASESGFGDAVAERAARLYAYPLIDELQPRIVIALGKKAAHILSIGGRQLDDLIVWNRAQAATPSVISERAATATTIFRRLGKLGG